MKNRPVLIIFFLALVSTIFVHGFNHSYLLELNPDSLREGVSVVTQDDASYLAPVENALAGKSWRSNAIGDAAYVTRTPGYSLIYAAFRVLLPQKSALMALLAFQFLLFAFGATLVYAILRLMGMDEHWSFMAALVYAIMPMFSGFLSYTLTEGVTPAFVILFMYLVLKSSVAFKKYYWWSTLVLALLIIIRPPMVVLLFVYPLLLVIDNWKSNWKKSMIALSIALFPLLLWQIYGYSKTEELPGLHAIYHDDANDLYRPVHNVLWSFHKSWGQEGGDFHRDLNGVWQAALNDEPPQQAIDDLIGHLPEGAIETVGEESLNWTYESYYEILKAQAPFFKSGQAMSGQTMQELALIDSVQAYTSAYRSAYWFQTWVVAPAQVYWNMAAHSNLSLYVFQKPWRGNLFMEAMRWLSFLVHLGVFLLFPMALIWKFRNRDMFAIGLPIAMYLGYLCFVQRGVEERYTLPFLMPMLIFVMVFTNDIFNQSRSKNGKTN